MPSHPKHQPARLRPTHTQRQAFTLGLFVLAWLFSVGSAKAIDVQRFRPLPPGLGGVEVPSGVDAPTRGLGWGLFINHVQNPIEFGILSTGQRIDGVLDQLTTMNLLLYKPLGKRFGLALDLPIHIYARNRSVTGLNVASPHALGSLKLSVPFRLLDMKRDDKALRLALRPWVTMPFDSRGDLLTDAALVDHVVGHVGAVVGSTLSFAKIHRVHLALGSRFRKKETLLNLTINNEFLWHAGYDIRLGALRNLSPFVEIHGSTVWASPWGNEVSSPIEWTFGARKPLGHTGFVATAGIGLGLTNGYGAPDYRVFGGLTHQLQWKKPSRPNPKPLAVPAPGHVVVRVKDEFGQELSAEIFLKDPKDIIKVKHTQGQGLDVFVPAGRYEAAASKEGYRSGFAAVEVGAGETSEVWVVLLQPKAAGDRIELMGKVLFEFDRAVLKTTSYVILDHAVEVLRRHPEITKVRVLAHTDAIGSEAYNLKLSDRRAASVMQYLIDKGIESSRLESKGKGESEPIATNETEEGRFKNRRVEFVIIQAGGAKVVTE